MNLINKYQKLIVILFFAAFLCLGLVIFDDYGISTDEVINRNNGLVAYNYVFKGDQELLTYRDRYYGTAFELFLVLLEKWMSLEDYRSIFLMRHALTFFMFFLGVIFFYLLARYHFKSRKMGLLAAILLILSPRIFAQSFYNSKDIVFLSFFIISIYSMVKYLDSKSMKSAILHALVCAILIDIRIIGIIVPITTLIFFLVDIFVVGEKRKWEGWGSLFLYSYSLPIFAVLFWPTLWKDPLGQFIGAISQMSGYPWDGTVLYLGKYLNATELPWHYIPVWIAVTTPVVSLALFVVGMIYLIREATGRMRAPYMDKRTSAIFLLLFFSPLVGIVFSGAVLYDGWRHMYFTYAPFLLISLLGVDFFRKTKAGWRKTKLLRWAVYLLAVIFLAQLGATSVFMLNAHPYQNIYFNFLAGDMTNAKENFEMDYWGLSYREALEAILEKDDRKSIKVFISSLPLSTTGRIPALMLPEEESERLIFTDEPLEADYFISNYRWHKEEYPYENEFYSIKVNDAKILVVYKLK